MFLSADDILKVEDRKPVEVDVPEWGGKVLVRALSGKERDAYEASMTIRQPAPGGGFEFVPYTDNANARLAVLALVDEDGNRLFRDEDAVNLGEKSGAAMVRIAQRVMELSGLGAAGLESAEGNSEAA